MIYTILCLLSVLNIHGGQRNTIERPLFVARNSDALEIAKIVPGDRETVFYMDARFCGGKLDGVDSTAYLVVDGKEYPLREARGITLAGILKTCFVQQEAFELVFPPIPESARTVDVFLSKEWRKIAMWGVELQKTEPAREKMVPVALRKRKLNAKSVWKPPVFKYARAELDIQVVGYKPEMGDLHSLTWGGMAPGQEQFLLDERGKATVGLNLSVSSLVTVYFGKRSLDIVLDPGEKATLYIDLDELNLRNSAYFKGDPRLPAGYFTGNRADLNQRLLSRADTVNPLEVRWDKNEKMSAGAYVDRCLREYGQAVEQQARQKGISDEYRRYLELESRVTCLRRVLYMRRNFADVYGWKTSDERLPRMEPEYFQRVAKLGLEDHDLALFTSEPFESMIRYFETEDQWKQSIGSGYALDFYKSQACRKRFMHKLPLQEEHVNVMSTASPLVAGLFREIYVKGNKDWNAYLAQPGYRVCEIPNVPDEKLLETILAAYRGKVVLVDFWGIYCRSCLDGIKRMKPLKQELKGKDIVYVYISLARNDATGEIWQQMVPGIGGDHYGLSKKSNRYLINQLGITGIPYYMIVDREGNVKYEQSAFPGCDRMRELLLQNL